MFLFLKLYIFSIFVPKFKSCKITQRKNRNQFTWNKVFQIIFPSSRKTISHTLYIFPTFVFPSKITQTKIKKHLSTSIIKRSKLFSPLLLLFETIRFKHRFISLAHKKIKSEKEKNRQFDFFSPSSPIFFVEIHGIAVSRNFCRGTRWKWRGNNGNDHVVRDEAVPT